MEGKVRGERGREEGRGQIREDRGLASRQVGKSAGRHVGKSAGRQVIREDRGLASRQVGTVGKSASRQVGRSAGGQLGLNRTPSESSVNFVMFRVADCVRL